MNTDKLQENAIRQNRLDQVTRRSLTSQQPIEHDQGMPEEAGIWDEDIELMELFLASHKKDVGVWW
jgi:hypothetical protein